MEMSVLLVDQAIWREGLKCVSVVPGELSVTIAGHKKMLMLCAANLDTQTQVPSCNVHLYLILSSLLFRCGIFSVFWSGYCFYFA